jgi:hypothetical protein
MDNPFTKYLEDVEWDNSLKLSNGKIVHGLEQLPMVIKFSDDEVFDSHVNDQKNDFADWIRDVIGYPELADKVLNIKRKDDFLTFMDKAIIDIKTNMRNYKPPAPAPVPASSLVSPPVSLQISSSAPVAASSSASVTPTASFVSAPILTPAPVTLVSVPISIPSPIPVVPVQTIAVSPTVAPTTVSIAPAATSIPAVETVVPEETFDFEEIFKVLLTELEQEVLTWDTQTN